MKKILTYMAGIIVVSVMALTTTNVAQAGRYSHHNSFSIHIGGHHFGGHRRHYTNYLKIQTRKKLSTKFTLYWKNKKPTVWFAMKICHRHLKAIIGTGEQYSQIPLKFKSE